MWRTKFLVVAFIGLLGIAFVGLGVTTSLGPADNYPAKPITVVVPFPAGGPSDVVARVVTEQMGTILGQSLVIEKSHARQPGCVIGLNGLGRGFLCRIGADDYAIVRCLDLVRCFDWPAPFFELRADAMGHTGSLSRLRAAQDMTGAASASQLHQGKSRITRPPCF